MLLDDQVRGTPNWEKGVNLCVVHWQGVQDKRRGQVTVPLDLGFY
ncbi:MAG: hypothetical protein ACYTHJ_17035 [Planctomycetota bacterium]|jgi:hypothetical protein